MAIIQWPCNNLSSVLLVGIAFYLIFQNSFFLTHFLLSFRLARHVRAVNPINIEQYLCSGHAGICNLESLGVDSYNVQQLKVAVIRKTGVRCFLVSPKSNSFKCFFKNMMSTCTYFLYFGKARALIWVHGNGATINGLSRLQSTFPNAC